VAIYPCAGMRDATSEPATGSRVRRRMIGNESPASIEPVTFG